MGNTASLPDGCLREEWVAKLVQPDFHKNFGDANFLKNVVLNSGKREGFRWPLPGQNISLTESQVRAIQQAISDYRLSSAVTDVVDSSYSRATKLARSQQHLSMSTAFTSQFQKDFELRLAVLRSLHGQLRAVRAAETEKYAQALSRKNTTWGKYDTQCLPKSNTSFVTLKFLGAMIRSLPDGSLEMTPAMVGVGDWLAQLPPLSLYKDWSPRPRKTKANSEQINFVSTLSDLAQWAFSTATASKSDSTRFHGRKMLQGLAVASGKLCIMLRFLEALLLEKGSLNAEEKTSASLFLKRLKGHSNKAPSVLPGGLSVMLAEKQLQKEGWRFSLGLGDFLQIELNLWTHQRTSSEPHRTQTFFRAQVMSTSGKGKIDILVCFPKKYCVYTVDRADKRLAQDGQHPVQDNEVLPPKSEEEHPNQDGGATESKCGEDEPSDVTKDGAAEKEKAQPQKTPLVNGGLFADNGGLFADSNPTAPPSTFKEFATRIIVSLSQIASAHEAPHGEQSYETELTSTENLGLEEPYCVEISNDTFDLLYKLLNDILSSKVDAQDQLITQFSPAVIKLVEVNLHRMVRTKINPETVGIYIDSDAGSDADGRNTFDRILPLLMNVLNQPEGDGLGCLQHEAAAAIDAGVDILFPSRTLRVSLLEKLLRHEMESRAALPSARRQLLDRLMWRFASKSSGAVTMIPRPGDSDKHSEAVRNLVDMLLAVASGEETAERAESSVASQATQFRNLRSSSIQLLASYQRHLVSAAAAPLPTTCSIPTIATPDNPPTCLKRKFPQKMFSSQSIAFRPMFESLEKPDYHDQLTFEALRSEPPPKIQDVTCGVCKAGCNSCDAGIPPERLKEVQNGSIDFVCILCEEQAREEAERALAGYIKAIVTCTNKLLALAVQDKGAFCKQHNVDADGGKLTLDDRVNKALYKSVVGILLPPIISAITLLADQENFVMAVADDLRTIIPALDKFMHQSPKFLAAEKMMLEQEMVSFQVQWQERIFGTSKTSAEKTSSGTPSATDDGDSSSWAFQNQMTGEWTPFQRAVQSAMDRAMESGDTTMHIRTQSERHPIVINLESMTRLNPRSGSQVRIRQHPEEMPTEDWICSRCTVINSQETSRCSTCGTAYTSTANRRGKDNGTNTNGLPEEDIDPESIIEYRTATKLEAKVTLDWIFDLYKTACTVAGKFCAALISGPKVSSDEIEMLPWLRLPIFSNGACNSLLDLSAGTTGHVSADNIISESAANPDRVAAIRKILYSDFGSKLMSWLETKATPNDFLKGKNKRPSLEKMLFASLVSHMNLWQNIETMMASEPSQKLTLVWRCILKFRNWIRQERQSYIRKEKEAQLKTPLVGPTTENNLMPSDEPKSVAVEDVSFSLGDSAYTNDSGVHASTQNSTFRDAPGPAVSRNSFSVLVADDGESEDDLDDDYEPAATYALENDDQFDSEDDIISEEEEEEDDDDEEEEEEDYEDLESTSSASIVSDERDPWSRPNISITGVRVSRTDDRSGAQSTRNEVRALDTILYKKQKKLWETVNAPESFDNFCGVVEQRIMFTICLVVEDNRQHSENTEKSLMLYIFQGTWASPSLLLSTMVRRENRASTRIHGLNVLCEILSSISFTSAHYDALATVGAAFRTKQNSGGDSFLGAMMESISKRTEAVGFLEGASKSAKHNVCTVFKKLYCTLLNLSDTKATPAPNPLLHLVVMWCFGIDWDGTKLDVSKDTNVCTILHQEVSLTRLNEDAKEWHQQYQRDISRLKSSMSEWVQKIVAPKTTGLEAKSPKVTIPEAASPAPTTPEGTTPKTPTLETPKTPTPEVTNPGSTNKTKSDKAPKKQRFFWSMWKVEEMSRYLQAGVLSKREVLANIQKCPMVLYVQQVSEILKVKLPKSGRWEWKKVVEIINPFLKQWEHLLQNDILEAVNSIVFEDLLCQYQHFFKHIALIIKKVKDSFKSSKGKIKIGEAIPSIESKNPNALSSIVSHRQACLCALQVISVSTAGGGREAKYDYEAASLRGTLRTATGCADEETYAKASMAAVSLSGKMKTHFEIDVLKNIIKTELEHTVSYFKDQDSNSLIGPNEAQMHLYETILLLKSLLPSPVALKWVLDKDVLRPLEYFMAHGALRIRRLIIRIFRVILCHPDFDENMLSLSKSEFVLKNVNAIGGYYLLSEKKASVEPNFGIGDIEMQLCCERVGLVRTLQQCQGWVASIEAALGSIIQDAGAALPKKAGDSGGTGVTHLGDHLAASMVGLLCIIGGHIECFRVGGNVKVYNNDTSSAASSAQAAGTIIHLSHEHGFAQVVFNKSIDATPDKLNLSDLVPVDEIVADGKIVVQLGEDSCKRLLSALQCFLAPTENLPIGDSILKCIATRALGHLIQTVPMFSSTDAFFTALVNTAVSQSSLDSFVVLHCLESRWAYVQQRSYESLYTDSMYSAADKKDNKDTRVNRKKEARRIAAIELHSIACRPVDLCIVALELNSDNQQYAMAWLFEKADEYVASGGLKRAGEETNPRLEKATQLCTVSQFPTWLCERALELNEDEPERAYEWLSQEDNGKRYQALYKQNEGSHREDARKVAAFDDSAAIDDMAENEAPIANSSSVGSQRTYADAQRSELEKKRRRGAPCVELKSWEKSLRKDNIIVTLNHTCPRLKSMEGKTGTIIGSKGKDQIVKFLDTETGHSMLRKIPSADLKFHEKLYGSVVENPANLNKLLMETVNLLCVRYTRNALVHLLDKQPGAISLTALGISDRTTSELSSMRSTFRERNDSSNNSEDPSSSQRQGSSPSSKKNENESSDAQSPPEVEPDDMMIAILQSMGYPDNAVRRALKETKNDVQRAAELLMNPEFTNAAELAAGEDVSASTSGGTDEGKAGEEDEEAMLSMAVAMSVNMGGEETDGPSSDPTGEVPNPIADTEEAPSPDAIDTNKNMLAEMVDPQSSPEAASACALVQVVKLIASTERSLTNDTPEPTSLVAKLRKLLSSVLRDEVKVENNLRPMSSLLVEECITHLIQSTRQGKKDTKSFESLHPYYRRSQYGGSAGFPGARALRVTFDPRCATQDGNRAALVFYSDEHCYHQIAQFSGSNGWRPFIVEAGKVYFKFISRDNEAHDWGYKFDVAPINGLQWVNEKELFTEASLEWACYVLDFLLNEGSELGISAAIHKPQVFDALVRYLCFPGAPYKGRVVSLLLQLLQSPFLFPADARPNLDALAGVGTIVTERCKANYEDPAHMPSSALQALVELEATRRKVAKRYAQNNESRDGHNKNDEPKQKKLPTSLDDLFAESEEDAPTGDVPFNINGIDPVVEVDLCKEDAPNLMLELLDMMESFDEKKKFSNALLSEVFLHNKHSEVFETAHPHNCGTSSGEVKLPGALRLELVFDGRFKIARNGSFEIQYRNLADKKWGKYGNIDAKPGHVVHIETDSIRWKLHHGGKIQDAKWGVRVMVRAVELVPDYASSHAASWSNSFSEAEIRSLLAGGWEKNADGKLTQWVNRESSKYQLPADICGSLLVCPNSIELTKNEMLHLPELSQRKKRDLGLRYCLLRSFNRRLKHLLNLIDLSKADFDWSIAATVRKSSHLIFADVKQKYIRVVLYATSARVLRPPTRRRNTDVNIDRLGEVARSKMEGITDPLRSKGSFVQLFNGLHDWHPAYLRREGQAFRVKYTGERGVDAGGLYRECLNEAAEELFSPHLALLLPTPNTRNDGGVGYVPNPGCGTPRHIKMFEFIGVLMGMSLRSDACLPFEFPSLVWKVLVGAERNTDDLMVINAAECNVLSAVRGGKIAGSELRFTVETLDGKEVELYRHGKNVSVDESNYENYATLVEKFRLHELDAQVQAIRRGFITIVPERILGLVQWQELEELVVGSSEIDVDIMRNHTQYGSRSFERSDTVKYFWAVLESFSNAERAMFVRFAWGRSRLPRTGKWENSFTLMKCGSDPNRLPVAHTCFFQLDLPPYRSEEEMREKLLIAINDGAGGMLLA